MYTIAGVSGQVGSAAAEELLADGQKINVLVRSEAKGEEWARRGATVSVVNLDDRAGLAEALRGSDGFFALLPTNLFADDIEADQRAIAEAIAGAVRDAAVPHVVVLSALGAERIDGPKVLRWLGELEDRLHETGTVLSAVRSTHFQEKTRDVLGAAQGAGIYPVFGESADVPVSMVATRDVGALVASTLRTPPAASQVIDIQGPEYTEREVAARLGTVLGRSLEVVTVPRPGWEGALMEAGLPAPAAELLADLYEGDERGILRPVGDRLVKADTPIETTLRHLVGEPSTVPDAAQA